MSAKTQFCNICKKSQQVFYPNDSKCAECRKAYQRSWSKLNRDKRAKYQTAWKNKNPEQVKAQNKKDHARYPERRKAHRTVQLALISGKLMQSACWVCGNPVSEAHHAAYDMPLAVTWLCRKHHRECHS